MASWWALRSASAAAWADGRTLRGQDHQSIPRPARAATNSAVGGEAGHSQYGADRVDAESIFRRHLVEVGAG